MVLDLTNYWETQENLKKRTILRASFRLDRKTMLEMLLSERILVNGEYYHVPEYDLLHCLINRKFGEIQLELEKIE